MLIELTIKNFRSFKEETTFSMVAESLKSNTNTFSTEYGLTLLPVAGIFGPNASGKSNLFKAVSFIKWAVENSNYLNSPVYSNPMLQPYKLDTKSAKKPSFFQIVLWDKKTNSEYRYGFEVSKTEIVSEWLFLKSKSGTKYTTKELFTREGNNIKVSKSMDKKPTDLANRVHPHALALTVFATLANSTALNVFELIKDKLYISDGTFDLGMLKDISFDILMENPHLKSPLINFLQSADLSIANIDYKTAAYSQKQIDNIKKLLPDELHNFFGSEGIAPQKQILTAHKIDGSDELATFNMEEESLGTQRLFGLGVLILSLMEKGGTIFIDEFGASLHPFISKAIVHLFQSKKTNPNNAQLVFITHETFLLSSKGANLRRDQIWFTQKNTKECASLHSLAEYKTKNDLEIAKNYLDGRFGAVPVTTFED